MHIAVSGGSGDLGRDLVPYLVEQGHTVVSMDRTLPNAGYSPTVRYMQVDTTNFGEFVAAIRGCDALIHLAAHRSPGNHPDPVVYGQNTQSSYNALSAAATLGIQKVALASSINAIGGAFSREPRYEYFPVDELHPTYAEDPYSLSKWVLEQQADAFARRYTEMRIASMRLHWLVPNYARAAELTQGFNPGAARHLWAYTKTHEASRAFLLALEADYVGHEVFYIVANRTAAASPSLDLAAEHYPQTPIRGDLNGQRSFFDCSKAARLLGWQHEDEDNADH